MIKRIRIVFSLILCFAFVAALGGVPAAQAAPVIPPQPREIKSDNGELITVKATDSGAASVPGYTVEQRQSSKPLGLINLKQSDINFAASDYSNAAPGSKAGSMPNPEALAQWKAENQEFMQRPAASLPALQAPSLTDAFGTKNTWDGYLGNYFDAFWLEYPYSTVGRLYFNDGYNIYNCSASLINYDVIVTAAHCVYDTDYNYWYGGWQFVPADWNYASIMPWGYYNYYSATILSKWASAKKSSKGLSSDVAILELYGNGTAPYAGYYAGWLGYSWNTSTKMVHHAIGYPSNIFSGISSYICVGESFSNKGGLGLGCDMTYGSSGGPWILWFTPYQFSYPWTAYGNYVNSVVSGGNPSYPTFYGPRFTTSNIGMLCWGTGLC